MTVLELDNDLLRVNGGELSAFIPQEGAFQGDSILAKFFTEVKDINKLQQLAAESFRSEAMQVETNAAPNFVAAISKSQPATRGV